MGIEEDVSGMNPLLKDALAVVASGALTGVTVYSQSNNGKLAVLAGIAASASMILSVLGISGAVSRFSQLRKP